MPGLTAISLTCAIHVLALITFGRQSDATTPDSAQAVGMAWIQVPRPQLQRPVQADLLTRQYKVQHIPALVAAGKYRTSPSMFFKRNQSGLDIVLAFFKFDNSNADKRRKAMGDTLNTADMLIAKVLAEGKQ